MKYFAVLMKEYGILMNEIENMVPNIFAAPVKGYVIWNSEIEKMYQILCQSSKMFPELGKLKRC